ARACRRLPPTMGYAVLLLLAALTLAGLSFAQLSSDRRQTYVVSGTVVNAVTGEAISRALVRATGQSSRSAFSDSEGRFQFEDLPAGQIMLIAQNPATPTNRTASYYVRSTSVRRPPRKQSNSRLCRLSSAGSAMPPASPSNISRYVWHAEVCATAARSGSRAA